MTQELPLKSTPELPLKSAPPGEPVGIIDEALKRFMKKAKKGELPPFVFQSPFFSENPDDMDACEHCGLIYNKKTYQWMHESSPLCLTTRQSKAMGIHPYEVKSDNQPNLSGC